VGIHRSTLTVGAPRPGRPSPAWRAERLGCLTVPGMMGEIALVGRAIMPNAT